MLRITVSLLVFFGPALVPLVIASRRWRRDERGGRFRSLSGLVALLCVGLSFLLNVCAFGYGEHVRERLRQHIGEHNPSGCGPTANEALFYSVVVPVGVIPALIAIVAALMARSGIRGMVVLSAILCLAMWPFTFDPYSSLESSAPEKGCPGLPAPRQVQSVPQNYNPSLVPILLLAAYVIVLVSPRKLKTLGRMGLALVVALVVLLLAAALLRKGDPELLGALFAQMSLGAADAVGLLHVISLRRSPQVETKKGD